MANNDPSRDVTAPESAEGARVVSAEEFCEEVLDTSLAALTAYVFGETDDPGGDVARRLRR